MLLRLVASFVSGLTAESPGAVPVAFSKPDAHTLVVSFPVPAVFSTTRRGSSLGIVIRNAVNTPKGMGLTRQGTVSLGKKDGPAMCLDGSWYSGFEDGHVRRRDLVLFCDWIVSYSAAEKFFLTTGTIVLENHVEEAPAAGDYELFLVNGNYRKRSRSGQPI